jgi:hypothetical protein
MRHPGYLLVGIVIIVAKLGGIQTHLADISIALEVTVQGLNQSAHGEPLLIEDKFLDSSQGITDVDRAKKIAACSPSAKVGHSGRFS